MLKIIEGLYKRNINNSFKIGSSIAQTLEHILAWRNYILELLRGKFSCKIEMNCVEKWINMKTYCVDEWQGLIFCLKQNQKEILKLIEAKTEIAMLKQHTEKDYNYC